MKISDKWIERPRRVARTRTRGQKDERKSQRQGRGAAGTAACANSAALQGEPEASLVALI